MPLPRDAKACQRVLERAKGATVACVTLLVLAVLCLLTGGSYHWNRAAVALREAKLDKCVWGGVGDGGPGKVCCSAV